MSFPYDEDFKNSTLLAGSPGSPFAIFSGWSESLNTTVVYKVMEVTPSFSYLEPYVRQEYELARKYNSPNICRVYDLKEVTAETSRYICIVMERLEGDWGQEILMYSQRNEHYHEQTLWERMYVLVSTLAGLQEQGAAHRDIKPQNIFISVQGKVKLGDFGSCKEIASYTAIQTLQGTPFYLSPKAQLALISGAHQVVQNAYKSDVFSLGMTFFHACLLEIRNHWYSLAPVERLNEMLTLFKYSGNLKSVLTCMISEDEEQRPDFLTLSTWLGLVPNLQYSLEPAKDWSQCCYRCGRATDQNRSTTLTCGHVLTLCSADCLDALCAECTNGSLPCKVCMSSEAVQSLVEARLFVTTELPQEDASVEEPKSIETSSGVCEVCRKRDLLFQICHPICYDCTATLVAAKNESLLCTACKLPIPRALLALFT